MTPQCRGEPMCSPEPKPMPSLKPEPACSPAAASPVWASLPTRSVPLFHLTVTDLRQYLYCPRVVYYTYCMPVKRPGTVTHKMIEGQKQHEETAEREKRRSLRAYGLTGGQRLFQVPLQSERLGLSGRLDMVIITGREVIPVEHKFSSRKVSRHHLYQLAAYALLVEERWQRPVRRGFVYLIPAKRAEEIIITSNRRTRAMQALREIRSMIATESMPPPTRYRGRCVDCEFRRYCGDID